MILCGITPVYVDPGIHPELGISLGMDAADVEAAIKAHPEAKAVFVNNPTYYGICTDIRRHNGGGARRGHGCARRRGARARISISAKACRFPRDGGGRGHERRQHAQDGRLPDAKLAPADAPRARQPGLRPHDNRPHADDERLVPAHEFARHSAQGARHRGDGRPSAASSRSPSMRAPKSTESSDNYAFSREIIDGGSVFDFDVTKLSVNTLKTGLAGVEVYDLLRDDYGIQIEVRRYGQHARNSLGRRQPLCDRAPRRRDVGKSSACTGKRRT